MSEPYVGEIRMFGGNFPPNGWMTCDGQSLPISEYETLFNLIGTTYGGDGQNTFNLPNLSGRLPVHMGTARSGTSYQIGSTGGVAQVTITQQTLPNHNHPVVADNNAANTTQTNPAGTFYGSVSGKNVFSANSNGLHPMMTLGSAGGSQQHDNMMPFLALTYIISLFGVFPSPS